jgi:predicted ATPase/DNA-binding XRE family transcriptional regulator
MKPRASEPFGARLKSLREAAGFTQEELATIAGLSVHAVSALERGERRRPHFETVRALSAALDLSAPERDALLTSARTPAQITVVDEFSRPSLPLPPTALLGRDTDLQTLGQWLTDSAARLITLIGPGGVGKTRLALELARGIAEDGATRVAFVPLAAIQDAALAAGAIAEALGLADISAVDLPRRARAACEGYPTLLVLDNFEQIQDAAPLVADLAATATMLRLLVTSRSALRVRGEREYPVGPLALQAESEDLSLADLARNPAVRLFIERVRDVQPDFRLTSANGGTVRAICRRLDSLPLALELAAPWMKVLTPNDLLRRLEQNVLLSTAGPRDLPERQRTINATVAWSYQLLNSEEQRAFRRLGALPGAFPIDAAAAVLSGRVDAPARSDQAVRAVVGLIDKSLLVRAEDPAAAISQQYQMFETVRAFAAFELSAAGERDDAMEGLVGYCTRQASLAAEGLIGSAQAEWLDRVRDELETYRGALTWLNERGRVIEASDIAWQLMMFWLIRGRTAEGLWWYQQILKAPSLPPAAESRALVGAGLMLYARGELEAARAGLTRALALPHDAGDADVVAQAQNLFGHVEHAVGNLNEALDWFTRGIEGFRAQAIPWGTGSALSGMAWVHLAAGDAAQAERLLDEAAKVLPHAGPWFALLARYVRAVLAVRRGSAEETIAVIRESLTNIRELQDRFAVVYALFPLAAAATLKGQDAWAARILGVRDVVAERTGATFVDNSVRDLYEAVERGARERLGPRAWAREYQAGRASSIDALLRDIDTARDSGNGTT